MKKILFINHSSDTYGAETVMLQLIKSLLAEGNHDEVYVLEPNNGQGSSFTKALNQIGVKSQNHFMLPYKKIGVSVVRSLFVLLYNAYSIFRLVLFVKKQKINIIYSNTSVTCIGIITARLMGVSHVWHFHEPVESAHGWVKSLNFFYRFFLSYKKNTVIFVSNTQKMQWQNQLPSSFSNSITIYNPIIKIEQSDRVSDKNLTFGFMGSWCIRKNIPFLLEVFAELCAKHPTVKLLLAKNIGDDEALIEKTIETLNLKDNVIATEEYYNAAIFYSKIDVFVLPSLSETWGMVVLEAMSVKKPVIVTECTGLKELFVNNEHCCFINPINKESLINAMEKMLDSDFREKIANAGCEKVKELDFNNQFSNSFRQIFNS